MRWYSPSQIAAVGPPEMPGTVRGINRLATTEGWRDRDDLARRCAGRGGGWEYHATLLPMPVQLRLQADVEPETPASAEWAAFERLPEDVREEARHRLEAVQAYENCLHAFGSSARAEARVESEFGYSPRTLQRYRKSIEGVRKCDRLPKLAPKPAAKPRREKCNPDAYAALKSDYLRAEGPGFAACYRRVAALASRKGWAPLPSERTMRRHLDADVSTATQTLIRQGRDAAKALYPAQTRTREHFHAMEAITMDGHRFDVFVKTETAILRPYLIAIQDLYSGKLIAYRIAASESADVVRLVIGDMISKHGIPESAYLDNGRAFASKDITGGVENRFRFRKKPDDPDGLLVTLGVDVTWTQPYSGQSKPIERAFRDLTDEISRHPACAGAYTGNKPDAKPENYGSRAVPLDKFKALVADRIAEHNARAGRKAEACKGRSFDETFRASVEADGTVIRWATEAQRALWLLAAKRVRARKGNGEIHWQGNRYWDPALTAFAGRDVTVRYDPDALHQPLAVYDERNALLCRAACIEKTGFNDTEAARRHARSRSAFLKALKDQRKTHVTLTPEELADLYDDGAVRKAVEPDPPRVMRPIFGGNAVPVEEPEEAVAGLWDEDCEAGFSNFIRLVGGSAS